MAFPEPPLVTGDRYTDVDGTVWVWDGDSWYRSSIQITGTYGGRGTTATLKLANPGSTRSDLKTQSDLNVYFEGRLDGLDAGVPDVDLSEYAEISFVEDNFLKKSGGRLAGNLFGVRFTAFRPSSGPAIVVGIDEEDGANAIIHANGQIQCASPKADNHATTKQYVDDLIKAVTDRLDAGGL